MFKIAVSAFAACLFALASKPAQAQTRVFVAAQGSDNNPCTFALPCRTFQHAHDTVAAGGEIDVLDPAGYGAVTITKAISIEGHGYAGVTASTGNAIAINAGPSDAIMLQGLIIDGVRAGANGIVLNSAGGLSIVDCTARQFAFSGAVGTGNGIFINPTMVTSKFFISRTTASDNGGNGIYILTRPGAAAIGEIVNTVANNNSNGIVAESFSGALGSDVTVTLSSAGGNDGDGISAATPSMTMLVRDTVVRDNSGSGVGTDGVAIVRLSRVVATKNLNGIFGPAFSYGDNQIVGNTNDLGQATLTPLGFH